MLGSKRDLLVLNAKRIKAKPQHINSLLTLRENCLSVSVVICYDHPGSAVVIVLVASVCM